MNGGSEALAMGRPGGVTLYKTRPQMTGLLAKGAALSRTDEKKKKEDG